MKAVSDRVIFIRVVEEGSITRAAEHLGLSLAVCSKRLVNLEERLGVRLLNRTTRRQHLTDEGDVYYRHCLLIQEDIDQMEASLAGMRDEVQGTLRVNTSITLGRKYISPLISEFLRQYPAIKLQLIMTDTIVDMVSEGVDVAVRVGSLADSSMVSLRLASSRSVLCASPDYLAKAGIPTSVEALSQHDCLLLSEQGVLNTVWEFPEDGKVKRVPVSGPISSNYGEVIRDATIGGLGIPMKAVWDIYPHLENGELVTVLDDVMLPQSNIYALHHNRRNISPKIKVWNEFLKHHLSGIPQ